MQEKVSADSQVDEAGHMSPHQLRPRLEAQPRDNQNASVLVTEVSSSERTSLG